MASRTAFLPRKCLFKRDSAVLSRNGVVATVLLLQIALEKSLFRHACRPVARALDSVRPALVSWLCPGVSVLRPSFCRDRRRPPAARQDAGPGARPPPSPCGQ